MKNRDYCEMSVNAALSALAEDCEIATPDDAGKVLTLLISTAALGLLAFKGKDYAVATLFDTIENVHAKAAPDGSLAPQFDARGSEGPLQ